MAKSTKNTYPRTTNAFQLLPHMNPHIRISPFLALEWQKLISGKINKKDLGVFKPETWLENAQDLRFHYSGRAALLACLKDIHLKRNDEVLILKTTPGSYISSCVTKTIEKVCRWSQRYSTKTRAVLVIHEFGFPCSSAQIMPFSKMGLPIIEDCAYAIGSRLNGAPIGKLGHYAIYSLTKYYPIPFGGILVSRRKIRNQKPGTTKTDEKLIKQTLASSQSLHKKWDNIRQSNWNYFNQHLKQLGFAPYFPTSKKIVPGAFVFGIPKAFAAAKHKKLLNKAGVESTVYYNQGGFYFPVHQFLSDYEKKYILFHFLK